MLTGLFAVTYLSLTNAAPTGHVSLVKRESVGDNKRGWRGGNPEVSDSLQDVLGKAHQGPLYDYPTSFTQGIFPVSLLNPAYMFLVTGEGGLREGENEHS